MTNTPELAFDTPNFDTTTKMSEKGLKLETLNHKTIMVSI